MEHPTFRTTPNGTLLLKASPQAQALGPRQVAGGQAPYRAKKPEEIDAEAWAHVTSEGGDTTNATLVLSRWKMQFGRYQGKIFLWLLENDMGYCVNLVASHQKERERTGSQSPLMANKDAFTCHFLAYPEFAEAVRFHRAFEEEQVKSLKPGQEGQALVGFGDFTFETLQSLYESEDTKKIRFVNYLQRKAPAPAPSEQPPDEAAAIESLEEEDECIAEDVEDPTIFEPDRPAQQQPGQDIWSTQRTHLSCIQDQPGVQLYTQSGRLTKGGVILPVYRCARGSTSLEFFHSHLNRFIPGTRASAKHFQAFLVDGLVRWNEDRAAAAAAPPPVAAEGQVGPLHSYRGHLKHVLNQKSQRVLDFTKPAEYTGELIGVEYLYQQTGRVLEDVSLDPDTPDEAAAIESLEEEDECIAEDVEDLTIFEPDRPAQQQPGQVIQLTHRLRHPVQSPLTRMPFLRPLRFRTLFPSSPPQTLRRIYRVLMTSLGISTYREGQPKGRFKAAKGKNTSCPGKESLQRCLLGPNSSPANWPSASRLVEAVCGRLCQLRPADGEQPGPSSIGLPPPPPATLPGIFPAPVPASHPPLPGPHMSRSTTYRKRKAAEAAAAGQGSLPRSKPRQPTTQYVCTKCSQPKTLATGHTRLFGEAYCASVGGKTVEEWREEMNKKHKGGP
ncbi:hypothetical protein VZT92_023882 [Zoarces viviparus]|uniref:Uncharacterized protein n=1 Tax=Zoarces viviparus TaxID=48416 RepID=A0AAW1E9Q7_ZOAVI